MKDAKRACPRLRWAFGRHGRFRAAICFRDGPLLSLDGTDYGLLKAAVGLLGSKSVDWDQGQVEQCNDEQPCDGARPEPSRLGPSCNANVE